jgi:hypothetical protein
MIVTMMIAQTEMTHQQNGDDLPDPPNAENMNTDHIRKT